MHLANGSARGYRNLVDGLAALRSVVLSPTFLAIVFVLAMLIAVIGFWVHDLRQNEQLDGRDLPSRTFDPGK